MRALEAVAGVDAEARRAGRACPRRWPTRPHDLAGELRALGEGIEAAAGELEAVEERLAVLDRLKRKHGGTIAAVLEHAERCRERRAELEGAEVALEEATAALAAARRRPRQRGRGAAPRRARPPRPSWPRRCASGWRAWRWRARRSRSSLSEREPGPAGADAVEFRIATNPGVPAGALRDIASGGELSRVMLALLGVAQRRQRRATLVFDEVDAGIGGHTARAVGERLRELAEGRQVVCITHLPQVASLAARHFSIAKDTTADPALATVTQLADGAVVGELVRMLGADEADAAARRHAEELLRAA